MNNDYEKIIKIIKQRDDLKEKVDEEFLKLFNGTTDFSSIDFTETDNQRKLREFDTENKEAIIKYDEFYDMLAKKVVDKIDAMPLNSNNSFAELTKEALMEYLNEDNMRILNIYNEVMNNINDNDYYLDYSKYEDLDVGLPYSLEFIKLGKFNKKFATEIENISDRKLEGIDEYIIKKMTTIINKLNIGATNTFYKLLSDNIIDILDINIYHLVDCIYDCSKYKNYCFSFLQYQHINEEFKWFSNNKPYIAFTKKDDPNRNFLARTRKIEERMKITDEELEERLKNYTPTSNDGKINVDEIIKRIDAKIAELKKE